jgi:hypothetical protein
MKINVRNSVAKDLRTPKYRMRVVENKKHYNRNRLKKHYMKDMSHTK